MSGIVLTAAVRQNLLSLQNTADLLSTTQTRLSTGKKVNSALDNPSNFFTAQGLDNRASDISNLLDGISNGVQVLQAANTGITSLQKLVDSAKSIANQALQSPIGYSTKSNVSTTITGATASDLRGTTTYSNAVASGNGILEGDGSTIATSATKIDGVSGALTGTAVGTMAGTDLLNTITAGATNGATLTVNGKTITLNTADKAPATAASGLVASADGQIFTDANGNSTVYLQDNGGADKGTINDLLNAIDLASGNAVEAANGTISASNGGNLSAVASNAITINTSTGADVNISASANLLNAIGLTSQGGTNIATVTASRGTGAGNLGTFVQDGSTLNVNGKSITFKNATVPSTAPTGSGKTGNLVTDGNGNSTVYIQGGTVDDVLKAIDLATGVQTAAISGGVATLSTASGAAASSVSASGALQISTGTASDLNITGTGNALAALGLVGNTGTGTSFTAARSSGPGSLDGKTLSFSAFNGGTAVDVTFGDGTNGTVKSLNDLNAALQANNMVATLDASGKLTIAAGNDYASSTLGGSAGGAIGGTVTSALSWTTAAAPVADAQSQATRASLVSQFNTVLDQITKTAADASYNGINLLNGDQLQLVFNETGKSKLNITGVTYDSAGLGLSNLTSGTDFVDNAATNKVLSSLSNASNTLRSTASTFGSNLSVVQTRQDFANNLINVLQTGSSNLTIANTNEEAANSQALSTRQQIAVSALALANTSQQAVLRLLQ